MSAKQPSRNAGFFLFLHFTCHRDFQHYNFMYEENVRLGCTVYKLDRLIFANGERYPVLMGNDGMPHFLATLWVTTKLRSSLSVNTISNRLGALKWFLQWEENKHRDLFSEFQKGKFLSDTDIDNIKEHLSHDISHVKGLAKSKKTRDKVIDLFNTPRLISVTPLWDVTTFTIE